MAAVANRIEMTRTLGHIVKAQPHVPHHEGAERLSALETSVEALSKDVGQLARSIEMLRDSMYSGQRPQWGNMIAAVGVGLVVIGSIGTSFISPIAIQISNHDKVITDNLASLNTVQDRLRGLESDVLAKQLMAGERMAAISQGLRDVRDLGSPITRERLAIIESRLEFYGRHDPSIGPIKVRTDPDVYDRGRDK